MFPFIRTAVKFLFLVFLAFVLSACALTSGAGIRGASSMTIDVEVYKGPLSKTIQVQKHELEAQAADVSNVLFLIRQKARLQANDNDCETDNLADIDFLNKKNLEQKADIDFLSKKKLEQKKLEQKIDSITQLTDECFIIVGISYDAWELRRASQTMQKLISIRERGVTSDENDEAGIQLKNESISAFAQLGARLRARSDYWAAHLATASISKQEVRALVAEFAHYTSEFGNQLISRSDALLIQEQKNHCPSDQGKPTPCPRYAPGLRIAGLLSTGLYLRDSGTTNYLNLYDWADAIPGRLNDLKIGPGRRARVRAAQLLINDTYWSNINSVYASGQGDVSMAFIKDDIGNWNLKSFENDPTELLNAYDDVAISSLRQAARLTSSVASGGSTEGIEALIDLAGNASPNEQPQQGNLNVSNLNDFRTRLVENINTRETQYDTARDALNRELIGLQETITTDAYARLLVRAEFQRSLETIESQILNERQRILADNCNVESELAEGDVMAGDSSPAICTQLDEPSPENICQVDDTLNNANLTQLCQRREPLQARLNVLHGSAGSANNDAGITVSQACSQQGMDTESLLAANCGRHTEMTNRLTQIRRDTIADVQRFVADHKAVVNALQLSAAAPNE